MPQQILPVALWLPLPSLLSLTLAVPHPIGVWASLAVRNELFLWLLLGSLLFPWLKGAWRTTAAAILLGLAAIVVLQAGIEARAVAGWLAVQAQDRAVREPGNRTTEFWRRDGGQWRIEAAVSTTLPLAEVIKLSPRNGVFFNSEPN